MIGKLLIATEMMGDDGFGKTVNLIVKHSPENGAFGLCLNRPGPTKLEEVWQTVNGQEGWTAPCQHPDAYLFQGGPCSQALFALHNMETLSDIKVIDGVHFAAAQPNIEELFKNGTEPYRIFTGYAGWSPGQLESELKTGAWMVVDATPDIVFKNEDQITFWKESRSLVGKNVIQGLGIDTNVDPSLN